MERNNREDQTKKPSRIQKENLIETKTKGKQTGCYTYLLRCADGSLYTGWTNDLERRVKAHNAGSGAKYTRARRPVTLVYAEAFQTKEEAMQREAAIKQLTRKQKLCLIETGKGKDGLCIHCKVWKEA